MVMIKEFTECFSRKWTNEAHKKWHTTIRNAYRRMREKKSKYIINRDGFDIIVLPNVYAPHIFTDSLWFSKVLPTIMQDKSLLEIGCGTGILSIACALNGSSVTCTDINHEAVENAKLNAQHYRVHLEVFEGNVFHAIPKQSKFEFIFWAHPFNNASQPIDDPLLYTGYDYQYRSLRKYISGGRKHLTKNGKLLLGTGDSADLKTIDQIAYENNYRVKVLRTTKLPLVHRGKATVTYLLIEFIPNKSRITTKR